MRLKLIICLQVEVEAKVEVALQVKVETDL